MLQILFLEVMGNSHDILIFLNVAAIEFSKTCMPVIGLCTLIFSSS